MALRVAVIGDLNDDDPGFVGRRLVERHGARLDYHDRDLLPPAEGFGETDLVLSLGSGRSAHDPAQRAVVEAEAAVVRSCLRAGTPVLGICYGAQLLAHALGGQVHLAERAEIGWYAVESTDERLCPSSVEWAEFHTDAFTPPSTSVSLGKSPAGCQAFSDESAGARALGWQFHPEVTAERYIIWVSHLRDLCAQHGVDPDQLIAEAPGREPVLREAAYALTDNALAWLRP